MSFGLLLGAFVTGVLVYFFPGALPTEPVVRIHELLSWGFVLYMGLHVLAQAVMGGVRQLLKIMSPRLAYGLGAAVALTAGVAGAAVAYVVDRGAQTTLSIAKTDAAPTLDGDQNDAQWAQSSEVVVHTARGFNLGGTGEVAVHVKALHDGDKAYFLFRWPDATRSQKHTPVIKTEGGWKVVHSNYFKNDENEYYEDKFAVMLAAVAGGRGQHRAPGPQALRRQTRSVQQAWAFTPPWTAAWPTSGTGRVCARRPSTSSTTTTLASPDGQPSPAATPAATPRTRRPAGGFDQNFSKIPDTEYVKLKVLPKDLAAVQGGHGRLQPRPQCG